MNKSLKKSTYKKLFEEFVSFLFPEVCVNCGVILHQSERHLCLNCCAELPFTDFENYPQNPMEKLFRGRIALQFASATFYYRKSSIIQKLIHALKYNKNQQIGSFISQFTIEKLSKTNRFVVPDAIIEVPLHPNKLKIRGYNQLDTFAQELSKHYNIPILQDVLIKTQHTESQTQKSKWSRLARLEEKFLLQSPQKIQEKHLLLVDDVITTGATIEACALELLKAQKVTLSVICMSIADDS